MESQIGTPRWLLAAVGCQLSVIADRLPVAV
jgi:hypothetical protein